MNAPDRLRMNAPSRAAGQSQAHESARAQVEGVATYIDDIPEVRGTLHAAPVCSPVAHGILRGVDVSAALALPGVRAVIDAGDIPGDPMLAAFAHDEPVFALDTVQFVGQVIALVVADDVMTARRAARLVKLDIEPLDAVLSVHEAHALEQYVLPSVHVKRGDAKAALQRAPHQLEGRFEVGGQEHFYLEGQIAYVLPLEQNQWWVYTSTQHPGEVQHWVSHALGLSNHAVTVECRRMGGGFGGKETQAGHLAVWAAVAANQLRCPVKLRLDRDDDFMITGKRHPFAYHYRVGFDDTGLLCGLDLEMLANCGFSADLSGPVADRAIFHADNAYFLEDVAVSSYRCKHQHAEPHGVSRLRWTAGRDRDRAHPERHRAHARPGPARCAAAQPVWHRQQEHHPLPDEGGRQHPGAPHQPAGAHQRLPRAARTDRGVEREQPGDQKGPGAHAGEVRHQLHRHAVQPGRCPGARVHRRQRDW